MISCQSRNRNSYCGRPYEGESYSCWACWKAITREDQKVKEDSIDNKIEGRRDSLFAGHASELDVGSPFRTGSIYCEGTRKDLRVRSLPSWGVVQR